MGDAGSVDWAIGCHIRLTTVFDEEVSGTIFAYDQTTESLLLKQQGTHGGVSNLRLLKSSAIKTVLEASNALQPLSLQLPHVDRDRARAREEKALKAAEADSAKVGVGVTVEAQSVFDALARTMPCHWDDKTIVVMEVVKIQPPYSADSCDAQPDQQKVLDRVRTVLVNVRQNLRF